VSERDVREVDRLVLAVDCSTTAAKAVVFDVDGHAVGVGRRPLTMQQPQPGWHEQDATTWWEATAAAIAEALAGIGSPRRIAALCITNQRQSFVCLDESGDPIRPAILWLDSRATEEIEEFGTARVVELSGQPPDVTPSIYKLAWLRRHEPAVLSRAARVGDVQAYLVDRLTGRWATSEGSADALGLFDMRTFSWSAELLACAGVRREQLPELVPVGSVIAPLATDVAEALGLPRALPVIAGIGDGQAAGVGADALHPGTAYVNLGTAMVMGVQSDTYLRDPAFRTLAGASPGTYTLETVLNSATYVATWWREQFGVSSLGGAPDPRLEAAAARLPPGAEGLLTLPYWNCAQTPYWDPHARGAMVGWHGRHGPEHMYRSILEGVAYELRLHLEALEAATSRRIDSLRGMGGGTRSTLWTQILADVTQRPLLICAEEEISALGAAVLAHASQPGAGGSARSVASTAHVMASYERTVDPDPARCADYDRFFAVHRRLYPQLREIFEPLAAAARAARR
jgi:xylulokinase